MWSASRGELIGMSVDWWMNGSETGWNFLFPVEVELKEEAELGGADGRLTDWILWTAELSDSTLPETFLCKLVISPERAAHCENKSH